MQLRTLIGTPNLSFGSFILEWICKEFNILAAGQHLRQWAGKIGLRLPAILIGGMPVLAD
jgi:hypothetical protein